MTIIRTTCDTCGDVEVPAWSTAVVLSDLAEGHLHFTCPLCHDDGQVAADAAAVALLRAAGVPIEAADEPAVALDDAYLRRATEFLASSDLLCAHEALG